jgi:hypothetical protein
MKISDIVNSYGEKHTPYQGNLVNHLPMGQLAVFQLTEDLEKTKSYSELYIENRDINKVSEFFDKVENYENALGERNHYESVLSLLEEEITHNNVYYFIEKMLNDYPLGMSSGLFHVLIRLAYAYEGYEVDRDYLPEVRRAVAYYITAFRKAAQFNRKVIGSDIIKEATELYNNAYVQNILSEKSSLGQKMKALYENEEYMENGFVIDGSEDEKLKAVLNISLNAYLNSGSIVALHCITGTHALIVLKEFQNNFNNNIDILTTCIITHLIAAELGNYEAPNFKLDGLTWNDLNYKIEEEKDVHAVKLDYTAQVLNNLYPDDRYIVSAAKRLERL